MNKMMWFFAGFVLFVVLGCGTSDTSGGGSGNPSLRIPTRGENPPSGILEQLTWAGAGGGPRGLCGEIGRSCGGYIEGDQMIFTGFDSYQNLVVLVYRYTGGDSCGNSTAEYVTAFIAQVNSFGNMAIELSGNYQNIFIYEIYDEDTGELLLGSPIGGAYPCP